MNDLPLDVLRCPKDLSRLISDAGGHSLICAACESRYPIVDGIPVMLDLPSDTQTGGPHDDGA